MIDTMRTPDGERVVSLKNTEVAFVSGVKSLFIELMSLALTLISCILLAPVMRIYDDECCGRIYTYLPYQSFVPLGF